MHPAVRTPRLVSPLFLVLLLALFASVPAAAQQAGVRLSTVAGIQKTTRELMQLPNTISPLVSQARLTWELEQPDRSQLNQASGALELSTWPAPKVSGFDAQQVQAPLSPQVADLTFTGATLTDINAFPPDNQGAVGPSQYFVFVNGRLRTFNKATGIADGVLNADPDLFFSSVMTPLGGGVVINFTSDPQIRYDRLSGRWFLTIIDVPCANGSCTTLAPNRLLVAVSDAASNGIVSPATVWTLYYFQADVANFLDYPSLGIDSKALYIGGNMFTAAGSYVGTNGYVVRKTSALSGGPLVVTSFAGLALGAGDGPFAPRGVDNYDPAANEGYFIGVSNSLFGELVARRVSDPGGTPTISANLLIPVSTTSFPIPVQHFGNTGGNNGRLDALDDRLFQAHIRNGRLWTSHNIAVSATGVASSASTRRDGVRWYELNGIRSIDNGGLPVVVQSGTLFDPAATVAAARQYFIPSVVVSGQGHAALGYSTAGTPYYADGGTVGRLAGDLAGTLQTPAFISASATAYNPPGDPGGVSGRRWGDYSATTVDPIDDMTMWTIQEFCSSTNIYGCRIARLRAPLPATPTATPDVIAGQASISAMLTGTSSGGSGFYDPGTDLPGVPAFSHISAVVTNTGVTGTPPSVNSVTYIDPTTLMLDLNTVGADPSLAGQKYGVRVTNPDGQVVEGLLVLRVIDQPTATLLSMFMANPVEGGIELRWQFGSQVVYSSLTVERSDVGTDAWTAIDAQFRQEADVSVALDRNVESGHSYQYRLVVRTPDTGTLTFGPVLGSTVGTQSRFSLDSIHPNPSSGAVLIDFTVGRQAPARMSVLDIQGREIAVLFDGVRAPGRYLESWDASARAAKTPGIYFVRYRTAGFEQTRRVTITN
jgi:hypothetical protein